MVRNIRIISGTLKNRRILLPPLHKTRPTADRLKEAMFNIIEHTYGMDFKGSIILDAFSGSGALAFEALSRGAAKAYVCENSDQTLRCLQQSILSLQLKDKVHIFPKDFFLFSCSDPLSLIFLDPPYKGINYQHLLEHLHKQPWVEDSTLLCLETDKNFQLPPTPFLHSMNRIYGSSQIYFLKK